MYNTGDSQSGVLLNCMPPAHTLMPSASLNILKCFLKKQGIFSEIKYWNILLDPLLKDWTNFYPEEEAEVAKLLAFLNLLAFEYDDSIPSYNILRLILDKIKDEKDVKKKSRSEELLLKLPQDTNRNLSDLICREVSNFNYEGIILSGFSAKFYQWLPALFVAKETKKAHPEIKTVIGGFDSKEAAFEMMKHFECFDFAIWGEGEYPLLDLTTAIKGQTVSYSTIPALVYREENSVIISQAKGRKYFDLDTYPLPDHDDFFSIVKEEPEQGNYLYYPLESIRGCNWNRCKFCVLGNGYKYRERDVDNFINELQSAINNYNIGYFLLLDNNLIGSERKRLNYLLEQMIKLYTESEVDFNFSCEITPYKLDAATYRQIALAGFRKAQIGCESFSDSLIKKMNKLNSFSDNLLAFKYCLKFGINLAGVNIITGIPGETSLEVQACINNISFLRFFISNSRIVFSQSRFTLEKLSIFFKDMSNAEKENYTDHFIYKLLPGTLSSKISRFDFFCFRKLAQPQEKLWLEFFKCLEDYYKTDITYKIFKLKDCILYEEFNGLLKTTSIIFDDPRQWQILVNANERLVQFNEMLEMLKCEYTDINSENLKIMMDELKAKHIIYFNENYDNIVSIIDTDLVL